MLLVQGQGYRQQYDFDAVHLLPVNFYGPGDRFDLESANVVPALIRRFHEAKLSGRDMVEIWGDGSPSREFLYVGDCARAIRLALERYDGAEPINIGTGREVRIRELVRLIQRQMGFRGRIVWDRTKPAGQARRRLDVSRARRLLGFKAKVGLEAGLRRTIRWYLQSVC